jgi:hypothetical protein
MNHANSPPVFSSGQTFQIATLSEVAMIGRMNNGNTTHGMTKSTTYNTWKGMKARCHNPRSKDYPNYGGRGLVVCEQWRTSFEAFLADMGPRPSPRHSLDRRDNDKGYGPDNCRWITPAEQQHNTRRTQLNEVAVALIRHMRARGERVVDLAHAFGVRPQLVTEVIQRRAWVAT